MCVCVCVCVCGETRKEEAGKEGGGKKEERKRKVKESERMNGRGYNLLKVVDH